MRHKAIALYLVDMRKLLGLLAFFQFNALVEGQPSLCSAGNYGPSGSSTCTACPAGTYNAFSGSTSATVCTACASGKYGTALGQATELDACPNECPSGLWSPPGSTASTACVAVSAPPSNVFAVAMSNTVNSLWKFDLTDSATPTVTTFTLPAGETNNPGVCTSPDGSYAMYYSLSSHKMYKLFLNSVSNTPQYVAGSGSASRVDGVGTAASLRDMYDCDISEDGTFMLIPDYSNNAIRRMTLTAQNGVPQYTVTTIVGTCSGTAACTSGNVNGPGLSSTLSGPTFLDIDPTQSFAAVTTYDNFVKMINLLDGVYTTSILAGTGATSSTDGSFASATFNMPYGCSFSGDGKKLIVLDRGTNKLRLLNMDTQQVTTLSTVTATVALGAYIAALGDFIIYSPYGPNVAKYSFSTSTTSNILTTLNNVYGLDIWRCSAPGYGSDSSSLTCVKCPAGKFSSGGICKVCPIGTWSASGALRCTQCASGTYSSATGVTSASGCISCPSGAWSSVGATSINSCLGCNPTSSSAISMGTGVQFTDVPGYRVHRYTATGATTVTFSRDVVADVLVVGGGGAGGADIGGGGGSGAVVYYSGYRFLSGKTYSFTVGAGAAGEPGGGSTSVNTGENGADSSIVVDSVNVFVSKGGGGGGSYNPTCSNSQNDGLSGGSAGGGSACGATVSTGDAIGGTPVNTNALSAILGYTLGNSGGQGYGHASTGHAGAGGGGASAAGSNGASLNPGVGGDGTHQVAWAGSSFSLQSLFGSAYTSVAPLESDGRYYISGGGGGGGNEATAASQRFISGGKGGGGSGRHGTGMSVAGTGGKANTGGGGGGGPSSYGPSGAGGSGLILLRYTTCQPCSAGTQLVNPGSTGACGPCEPGKYSASGQTTCSTCPVNSGSFQGSDKCIAAVGSYQKHALVTSYPIFDIARSCGADQRTACTASMSSTYTGSAASKALDTDLTSDAHTNQENNPWWRVDFGIIRSVQGGKIIPHPSSSRTDGFKIWIGNDGTTYSNNINCFTDNRDRTSSNHARFSCYASGRYLFVHLPFSNVYLGFCDFEAYPYYTPSIDNNLLVFNNDLSSDTFWGLSGSVSVIYPQNIHPSALIASPQIPPAISDNDYPVVTDTAGKVVKPYVWYKFDSGSLKTDSSGNAFALTDPSASGYNAGTTDTANVKRGSSSANFKASQKGTFLIPHATASSMGLPTVQTTNGVSIAFWGMMTTSTHTWGRFFELTNSNGDALQVSRDGGAATNIIFYMTATNQYSVANLVDASWHHFVWAISSAGVWSIWVDNVKKSVSVTANIATISGAITYKYAFGSDAERICGASTCSLDGNVDDFRIYKGVLTDAQVSTLYQGRVGVYTASFGNCPDSSSCSSGSKHCNSTGDTACCVAGQYLRDGVDGTCQSCPVATYATDGTGQSCTRCAAGTWAPLGSTSAAACTACGAGTCASGIKRCTSSSTFVCCGGTNGEQFFEEGVHTTCQTCLPNLYGDGSSTMCLSLCPAGQYKSGSSCVQCPAGTFRATNGATSLSDCTTCPQYSYSPYKGATACTACAANI